VAGERIMFGKPGPELDYWEGEESTAGRQN
jgi:hypothetical protein